MLISEYTSHDFQQSPIIICTIRVTLVPCHECSVNVFVLESGALHTVFSCSVVSGTYCGVFRRQALDRGAMLLKVDKIVTGVELPMIRMNRSMCFCVCVLLLLFFVFVCVCVCVCVCVFPHTFALR